MPRKPAEAPDLIVAVIGAGAMGRGIAQVAATGGARILLHDTRAGAAREARDFIAGMLTRAAEKGRMTTAEAEAASARLTPVSDLSELAPADVVCEAIIEDMATKSALFAALEKVIAPEAILASNTSSLSITRLASACTHPERVAGFHFFNPVPLMPLVEVIAGIRTAPAVLDHLTTLGSRMGRTPVRVADAPGFLVNQVGRGYTIEATHLVAEGVAEFACVDRIMREAAGFRMGPFELLDLTALDVTHPATVEIYEQCFHEPRFRPATLMGQRMQAGLLGRKSGEGHYRYDKGQQITPPEAPMPGFKGGRFWIDQSLPDCAGQLAQIVTEAGGEIDSATDPGAESVILITPLGEDATSFAVAHGLDATRSVAVDPLFGFKGRRSLMGTPITRPDILTTAQAMLGHDGTPATVLRDSPGFVAQRILACIINIAAQVASRGVAAPADIDRAVTLGLNYPNGPLAWADALGAGRILAILEGLHRCTGDPRYRPDPWLRRRAQLGVSMLTEDTFPA
ncbi:3-hydroxyacyl-CoA dehydrogenase [Natronohydrobacter thiooxidans]|uniref:3-hydroxyacyl-CoA dehydrogenase n=1 Tax=Natronohydrobacter thiooxidans TaxID=87172 RepID=UPI0008FF43A9|nr:3-hydroxyacyl-CoA dehydrogenase [Natronohydrobacter thiooxidans]